MNELPSSEEALKNLRRYLQSRGWIQAEHANNRIEVFHTPPDDNREFTSIFLPRSVEFRDAGSIMNEAVDLLAIHENTPAVKVVDHVLRWDRDILRSRLFKMIGTEDSLPLGIAANTIFALKEFLGYAAYTHSNPRPFFDKAGAISGAFADQCRFAHTFKGSFGLTVECPFTVESVLPLDGINPVVPPERQVFERVANGLHTLQESVKIDSIDPLLAGYLTGLNANMCRKLSEIFEKADGRRIEYDISWSPQIKTAYQEHWKPMVFDGRAYEFAKIAAVELEKSVTFPDSVVEGRIVVLKSEMPPGLDEQAEFEHIITMFWEREKDQVVHIRVALSPDQYRFACDAHKDGRRIRVQGIPEKAGKFWSLTRAHDFMVI